MVLDMPDATVSRKAQARIRKISVGTLLSCRARVVAQRQSAGI
jgi:hypothetical protein